MRRGNAVIGRLAFTNVFVPNFRPGVQSIAGRYPCSHSMFCTLETARFDEDALTICNGIPRCDDEAHVSRSRANSDLHARQGAAWQALRTDIPAYLDQHLKRYSRASGEFELRSTGEPEAGDVLVYQHVMLAHSPENLSSHFGEVVAAWQRQLPDLICPLKFEDGRLYKRLAPRSRHEAATWEEDITVQADMRWLEIPEVLLNTDLDAMLTIPAVVFLGVVDVKHQCRAAASDEERQGAPTEPSSRKPTSFMFARQRFCDFLVEVFGA
jgi:hypothetical protein